MSWRAEEYPASIQRLAEWRQLTKVPKIKGETPSRKRISSTTDGARKRLLENPSGPVECRVYVSADIFTSDLIKEAGSIHHQVRLSVGAAQDEVPISAVQLFAKVFERVEACGVHREHFAHSQDENLWFLSRAFKGSLKLVRHAEKEGAEDSENKDIIGHILTDERVVSAFGIGAFVYSHDLRRLGDAFDKEY